MFLNNLSQKYCSSSLQVKIIDNLVTTVILCIFFIIGSSANLLLVSVHFQRRKRKSYRCHTPNRTRNQVNNQAIYFLSVINLILSGIFVPYTIFFRVWQISISTGVIKIMEHLKDSLIYMNLFIISVISIERYFAVCKPQYYKTLESNINKIIWMVYIFFFCFSASNYLTDIKLYSNCAIDKEISSDQKESKFSFEKLLNYLNVILSTFFFIATAIISSSFYCKVTFHRSNASFNLNNHLITNKKIKKQKKNIENLIDSQEPVDSTNSLQKNQSNASVQTDFNTKFDKEIKKKKFLRQRSSSTKVLTKISILLSAIIWLSTLPFVLIVIGILPFLKFLYFLFYIENVLSPLVYISLNKKFRNNLKKFFKNN